MRRLWADLPDAVANTAPLAGRLEFTLSSLGYEFPGFPVGEGETMEGVLRERTFAGARTRFPAMTDAVIRQLDYELALINRPGFAGYFLIVWDVCRRCREAGIMNPGAGFARFPVAPTPSPGRGAHRPTTVENCVYTSRHLHNLKNYKVRPCRGPVPGWVNTPCRPAMFVLIFAPGQTGESIQREPPDRRSPSGLVRNHASIRPYSDPDRRLPYGARAGSGHAAPGAFAR
ncbi:hypothetical protein OPIT5_22350 [Opitutaceae bacterium TAV5]|nr:hypothetical protein OPIT5_22350 [Opitutaceae bacterium TAV5]